MEVVTFDGLYHILEYLRDDQCTLYHCSLVNRTFRDTAAKLLYAEVMFSPPLVRVLNLRKKDVFMEGIVPSALLPHNASHVLIFEFSGYPWYRPQFPASFTAELKEALQRWRNLHTITLAPKQFHGEIFNDILPLLPGFSNLHDLTVNSLCADEARAPMLVQVGKLSALTIENPPRAILSLLSEWLSRLSGTLTAFHLKLNCGSVTPGVLRSFLPHLEPIRFFSLGLSYSLMDDDVFSFLNHLPDLQTLELRYYLQLRAPTVSPCLNRLRSLTVLYTPVVTKEHVTYLCKWIRRVITHSPVVSLRLLCEGADRAATVAYDGLVQHIYSKHAETLRVLRMDMAFVGKKALRELLSRCHQLEELSAAISCDALDELSIMIEPLRALHTLSVETRHSKLSHVQIDTPRAKAFFHGGTDSLRHLAVNKYRWQGQWRSTSEHEVQFVVKQVSSPSASRES